MKQNSRLGTTTGSVMNYLMGNNATLPEVGKGATILSWTDRHAYEVMSVSKDLKTVVIQQYIPERLDKEGMSETQDYKYEKLNGRDETIVWKHGKWRKVGKEITFVKGFYELYESQPDRQKAHKEMIAPLFNDDMNLMLVEGKTKERKTYSPVNIIFGVKQEYYDYSF